MRISLLTLLFFITIFSFSQDIIPDTQNKDKLADEPTAQPTNLTFSNIKSYTFNVYFTSASPPPENYIVLRKNNSSITETPIDGVTYQKGDYIGTAQVSYIGSGNSFTPSNIIANTTYYFAVFSFNGQGGDENYLQTNPLSGNVTTSDAMIGNYYDGIVHTSQTFIDDLHNLINPHTQLPYGDYDNYMINNFESRDTSNGQKVVTCVYSGYNYVYTEPFAWDILSREHTFCHSWMPTNPAQSLPEYSDYHNLFPTHHQNANAIRSNYPLGIVENVTYEFLDGKFGQDEEQNWVYEPRDAHKGDAARALFYMVLCYNNVNGNKWNLPSEQNQNILKQWHFQDPPGNWEIARNDYIYSIQNNRNPFIDSINFVNYMDFYNLEITDYSFENEGIIIYPNPCTTTVIIRLSPTLLISRAGIFVLYDLLGNEIFKSEIHQVIRPDAQSDDWANPKLEINLSGLDAGVYLLKLDVNDNIFFRKIVIL